MSEAITYGAIILTSSFSLLSALMCFSMDIHLTPGELEAMAPLVRNCANHISVVNDIWSWEKEFKASQTGHHEGSAISSAVLILAKETNLSIESSKRVLSAMVTEWERVHDRLAAEQLAQPEGCSPAVKIYMKGLEYQMSGTKFWSKTTLRYNDLEQKST